MARHQAGEPGWQGIGIPFGSKGGKMWTPMDVPRGKLCRCLCPGCGAPLNAKHGNGGRRPHFAHVGVTQGDSCAETALHRYAKQVLAETSALQLPAWTGADGMPNPPEIKDDNGEVHWGADVLWPGRVTPVWDGQLEVDCGTFRPDVTVEDGDGSLWVEVLVTHKVGAQKAQEVRQVDGRMLEIDLSDTPEHMLEMPEAFKQWVLYDAPRHWVWLPEAARAWSVSHRQLQAELQAERVSKTKPLILHAAPPMDWEALRVLFADRELIPINQPPLIQDDWVGAWIWLDELGPAEIQSRLVRGAPVYRVQSSQGEVRSVHLRGTSAGKGKHSVTMAFDSARTCEATSVEANKAPKIGCSQSGLSFMASQVHLL